MKRWMIRADVERKWCRDEVGVRENGTQGCKYSEGETDKRRTRRFMQK